MASASERSSGGVIYRQAASGVEVALISTRSRSRWQLPKGHPDPHETDEVAAIRETAEETGLRGEIERDLGEIEYWYSSGGKRVKKQVHFFLLRYLDGDTSRHDAEVDEARWFPLAEARSRLSFESERDVLDGAMKALGACD